MFVVKQSNKYIVKGLEKMKKIIYYCLVYLLLSGGSVNAQNYDPMMWVSSYDDDEVSSSISSEKRVGKYKVEVLYEISGRVPNTQVYERKIRIRVDCKPENFPDTVQVAIIKVLLGDRRGNFIKMFYIPPGAEDWYVWTVIKFLKEKDVQDICKRLEESW